ncbi:MAG: prolyl oligopeptidase family serine peptidase [Bacteroidetes bacterium]|nr:prolyl oligopeptidase family serine peptidase [Bacteroidota bacterium]
MPIQKNIAIPSVSALPVLTDLFTPIGAGPWPVLMFCHGFKGFKDWGWFPHMHKFFCEQGIAVLNIGFSHNGTDAEHPMEFVHPERFAAQTVSGDLAEINNVIDWVCSDGVHFGLDPDQICLTGHSRGGALAILAASKNKRIKQVVTWAAISAFGFSFAGADKHAWKENGHILIPNQRTGQTMPLNYSYWQDIQEHAAEFNIPDRAAELEIPLLILHGAADTSVPVSHALEIYEACIHSIFIEIDNTDHTFGAGHPFTEESTFTTAMVSVFSNTASFIV